MDTQDPMLIQSVPARRRRVFRLTVVLLVVAVVSGAGIAYRQAGDESPTHVPAAIARAADGAVIIPNTPVNGVLEITIPPGTAESMAAGGRGYELPPVINLHTGDKIIIHNNDGFPHLMMFAFVLPGESTERTFTKVGSETYSAGCTIDPTPNGFTSLFVSE